ncbi:MAG: 16S rRNA (cytidine(1402)-2'-O)-methyltransferase [bacterium]
MAGHLYIVGTPIGNVADITIRAIETLRSADLIACEDTRHTKILLDKYGIKTPTTSYHKFNIKAKTGFLIDQIKQGKTVALVSDAGTPGISDPGQELVRSAAQENIKTEVVPGASALISALSVSGLKTDRFAFEGFLPVKPSSRKEFLRALSNEERTIVLYEAPHRILRTLEDLKEFFGDRNICIARELTKKFEEISRGKIAELIKKFSSSKPRGEFVIVIEGEKSAEKMKVDPELLVGDLVAAGVSRSNAVKIVAGRLKVPKNKLYRTTLND